MDDRASPRGHPGSSTPGDAYRRALDDCARVAREEFSVVENAFDEAERVGLHV
jgi:hypothetical protein